MKEEQRLLPFTFVGQQSLIVLLSGTNETVVNKITSLPTYLYPCDKKNQFYIHDWGYDKKWH